MIAKCIASRIKKCLPEIVHRDQTGFLKDRYIGENINRILSILELTEHQNIPAVTVLIDFEKAFDSLEWSFVEKSLEYFNFGSNIQKWVKTLYNKANSCVINNGWATKSFTLERGVRQGCPLSPYLFLLAAEILAVNIRQNKDIAGVTIRNETYKISQFADDTTLTLQFSHSNLDNTFKVFDKFQEISGLKVNYDKTEIMPMGSLKQEKRALYTNRKVKWANGCVKLLGINITYDKTELIEKTINLYLLRWKTLHNYGTKDSYLYMERSQ